MSASDQKLATLIDLNNSPKVAKELKDELHSLTTLLNNPRIDEKELTRIFDFKTETTRPEVVMRWLVQLIETDKIKAPEKKAFEGPVNILRQAICHDDSIPHLMWHGISIISGLKGADSNAQQVEGLNALTYAIRSIWEKLGTLTIDGENKDLVRILIVAIGSIAKYMDSINRALKGLASTIGIDLNSIAQDATKAAVGLQRKLDGFTKVKLADKKLEMSLAKSLAQWRYEQYALIHAGETPEEKALQEAIHLRKLLLDYLNEQASENVNTIERFLRALMLAEHDHRSLFFTTFSEFDRDQKKDLKEKLNIYGARLVIALNLKIQGLQTAIFDAESKRIDQNISKWKGYRENYQKFLDGSSRVLDLSGFNEFSQREVKPGSEFAKTLSSFAPLRERFELKEGVEGSLNAAETQRAELAATIQNLRSKLTEVGKMLEWPSGEFEERLATIESLLFLDPKPEEYLALRTKVFEEMQALSSYSLTGILWGRNDHRRDLQQYLSTEISYNLSELTKVNERLVLKPDSDEFQLKKLREGGKAIVKGMDAEIADQMQQLAVVSTRYHESMVSAAENTQQVADRRLAFLLPELAAKELELVKMKLQKLATDQEEVQKLLDWPSDQFETKLDKIAFSQGLGLREDDVRYSMLKTNSIDEANSSAWSIVSFLTGGRFGTNDRRELQSYLLNIILDRRSRVVSSYLDAHIPQKEVALKKEWRIALSERNIVKSSMSSEETAKKILELEGEITGLEAEAAAIKPYSGIRSAPMSQSTIFSRLGQIGDGLQAGVSAIQGFADQMDKVSSFFRLSTPDSSQTDQQSHLKTRHSQDR